MLVLVFTLLTGDIGGGGSFLACFFFWIPTGFGDDGFFFGFWPGGGGDSDGVFFAFLSGCFFVGCSGLGAIAC